MSDSDLKADVASTRRTHARAAINSALSALDAKLTQARLDGSIRETGADLIYGFAGSIEAWESWADEPGRWSE